jgi:hypothetical protein
LDQLYESFTKTGNIKEGLKKPSVSPNRITKSIDWKQIFNSSFNEIINLNNSFIPETLNLTGSNIIKNQKFWVLWIDICLSRINFTQMIELFNCAYNHLNEFDILTPFYKQTMKNYPSQEQIHMVYEHKFKRVFNEIPLSFEDKVLQILDTNFFSPCKPKRSKLDNNSCSSKGSKPGENLNWAESNLAIFSSVQKDQKSVSIMNTVKEEGENLVVNDNLKETIQCQVTNKQKCFNDSIIDSEIKRIFEDDPLNRSKSFKQSTHLNKEDRDKMEIIPNEITNNSAINQEVLENHNHDLKLNNSIFYDNPFVSREASFCNKVNESLETPFIGFNVNKIIHGKPFEINCDKTSSKRESTSQLENPFLNNFTCQNINMIDKYNQIKNDMKNDNNYISSLGTETINYKPEIICEEVNNQTESNFVSKPCLSSSKINEVKTNNNLNQEIDEKQYQNAIDNQTEKVVIIEDNHNQNASQDLNHSINLNLNENILQNKSVLQDKIPETYTQNSPFNNSNIPKEDSNSSQKRMSLLQNQQEKERSIDLNNNNDNMNKSPINKNYLQNNIENEIPREDEILNENNQIKVQNTSIRFSASNQKIDEKCENNSNKKNTNLSENQNNFKKEINGELPNDQSVLSNNSCCQDKNFIKINEKIIFKTPEIAYYTNVEDLNAFTFKKDCESINPEKMPEVKRIDFCNGLNESSESRSNKMDISLSDKSRSNEKEKEHSPLYNEDEKMPESILDKSNGKNKHCEESFYEKENSQRKSATQHSFKNPVSESINVSKVNPDLVKESVVVNEKISNGNNESQVEESSNVNKHYEIKDDFSDVNSSSKMEIVQETPSVYYNKEHSIDFKLISKIPPEALVENLDEASLTKVKQSVESMKSKYSGSIYKEEDSENKENDYCLMNREINTQGKKLIEFKSHEKYKANGDYDYIFKSPDSLRLASSRLSSDSNRIFSERKGKYN